MMLAELDFSSSGKTPVILQTEVAECGLACVAMVASYFGFDCDVAALRRKFAASLKGLNLKHMMQVAERCGLTARAIRCELDELPQLQTPVILHWDLNHFVVLTRVTARSVWIHDPALGKVKLTMEECSKHFSGIALELSPGAEFKQDQVTQQLSIWQLWSRMHHWLRSLSLLFVLSLVLQVAAIATPYYMQWVVDHVLLTEDRDLLVVLALGFGLLMVCSALLTTLRGYLVLRMSSVVSLQMGVNLTRHLLRLPLSFFTRRHVGDVVSRFGSLNQVRERLTTGVVETLVDGVMSLLVLGVMLLYSVPLTALVLVAVLLYILVRAVSYGMLYRASEQTIKCAADEQTSFLENIRGIQAVRLFGAENFRLGLWQNRYTALVNSEIRLGKLNLYFSLLSAILFGAENILVVYFAAQEVLSGALSIGMVLAFIAYKNQLSGRLTNLVEQWIAFRMLRLHLDRLADIALTEAELDPLNEPALLTPAGGTGRLVVENLSFRYGDNEAPVLHDVNFCLEPGAMVAVVGASGGGKSTLVKLLLGLYQPDEGRLIYNDCALDQFGVSNYRAEVAAVLQGDVLLAGSVIDNISFFDVEPDHEAVQRCARAAAIHEEILALPMGYHSLVGDMGSQFSGGQVQRLLLARALYRKPKILFLDEATSHLDVCNERRVTAHIEQLGITRLVVAHRPETIACADQVLLVANGAVSQLDKAAYLNAPNALDTGEPAVM
jgi:ATP-binding cassette subfamily B protein RaxB